jgi:hypothetical protein
VVYVRTTEEAAKELVEDVPKHVPQVRGVEANPAGRRAARVHAGRGVLPEAVVVGPTVRVAQDGVRLVDSLELLFGAGIAGVSVGVVLQRELAKRLL